MNHIAEPRAQSISHAPLRLILILGALSAFAPFATDMYLSGFPAIARDLHTDVAHVQLSLASFFMGLCVGQLLYGPMTDAWGRRGPLLAGIWLFTVTSLVLVLSTRVEMFVGVRALQAIGGCAGMIVARAVIQDLMAPREAARTLSTMMMVQGLGPVLAPLMGSWLLALAGWKSVFVFLALFGGACLLAVWRALPETLPVERRRRLHLGDTLRTFGPDLRDGDGRDVRLHRRLAVCVHDPARRQPAALRLAVCVQRHRHDHRRADQRGPAAPAGADGGAARGGLRDGGRRAGVAVAA
jgi:DHA1 family bicyclomycin/chloramphenicol resistance-like MFS transporter